MSQTEAKQQINIESVLALLESYKNSSDGYKKGLMYCENTLQFCVNENQKYKKQLEVLEKKDLASLSEISDLKNEIYKLQSQQCESCKYLQTRNPDNI